MLKPIIIILFTQALGTVFAVDKQHVDSLSYTDNYDLDEIVITATRVPKLLKDTPIQTRLITSADIKNSDATNIQDLLQQELPGLEFSYAMNQQVHLNFNGQGGQSVLFLLDGERLAGETMDDVDFSRLDMSNVERIEIVKGASSALYGSNAIGGVINIITKEASHKWNVTANARFARHNEQRYNISVLNRNRVISNIFSINHNSIDNYDVHNDLAPITRVVSTIYGNNVWNFKDQIKVKPAENLKITGRLGYYYRQLSMIENTPERYRNFTAGINADWTITENDQLNVTYSFDQYDKSNYQKHSDLDIRNYSNVQNSVRALYNHTFSTGDILTAGADIMRDFMLNNKMIDSKHSLINADAFLQYDWIINHKWELVGAARYDYFSDSKTSRVTPKISVRYRPINSLNFRFGYGMGFRAPTLKERYYEFNMSGIWIVKGNPLLKAESSHNFNISADYSHKQLNYTINFYYNDINNKISTGVPYYQSDDIGQLYLGYTNLSNYAVWGFEATIQGQWSNGLFAKIAYAYTKENIAKDKSGVTANNQYIPARPHSLTTRIGWNKKFSKKYILDISINGRFLSSVNNEEYIDYYNIDKGTVSINYPAYSLWKLSVVQSFGKHVRINLALDNILNYKPKFYYLNCPLTDGINFIAGISLDLYK